jgi:hypothetical protein
MTLYQVTVQKDNVVLPNGRLYQDTDVATLTEEEFHQIDPAQIGAAPLLVSAATIIPVPTDEVP